MAPIVSPCPPRTGRLDPEATSRGSRYLLPEFYVQFCILKRQLNEEKSLAEEGGGGGVSPSIGPSTFLISIFPPFQFPPLPVETGSPRHNDGKAAIFTCEAVMILNNCLLNKQTNTQRKKSPPNAALPPTASSATDRPSTSQQTRCHPGKMLHLHLSPIFLVASYTRPCLKPSPVGQLPCWKAPPSKMLLRFWKDQGKKKPLREPWRELLQGPRVTSPSGSSSLKGQCAQPTHLLCKWPLSFSLPR